VLTCGLEVRSKGDLIDALFSLGSHLVSSINQLIAYHTRKATTIQSTGYEGGVHYSATKLGSNPERARKYYATELYSAYSTASSLGLAPKG
jgi:hypothetical protein